MNMGDIPTVMVIGLACHADIFLRPEAAEFGTLSDQPGNSRPP